MSDKEITELFLKSRAEANKFFREAGQLGYGAMSLEYALRKVYEAGKADAS